MGNFSNYNGKKYVAVNGDEGEPGTFKDRSYLEVIHIDF